MDVIAFVVLWLDYVLINQIADFGVSEEIDTSDTHLSRSAGTPAFTAPECLDGECHTLDHTLVPRQTSVID